MFNATANFQEKPVPVNTDSTLLALGTEAKLRNIRIWEILLCENSTNTKNTGASQPPRPIY
jgi:hypothetical protein